MANINKIKLSGTTYNIQDENATKTVELTQAQYDALTVKDPNTFYIITDAQGADLSNYYTKSETSGATEISTALGNKQDTLVSGTNIKTINNESILGSGNITIEGGGKAVSAGTNISITTGETADTINCTLPIRDGIGYNSIYGGDLDNNSCWAQYGFAYGDNADCGSSGAYCMAFGSDVYANSLYAFITGKGNTGTNSSQAAFGQFTVNNQANTTWGDSGNTLFSVGNGIDGNSRHNAFEIRQNGDIYITKDGQDVKLQDQLGGTVDTEITSASTNPVTSAAIYNQFGGLKLVKLTQAQYDALATKDSNTLYIIEEAPECNTPQGATYHTVDNNFDKTTQIYGVDFGNYDALNNEPTTFTVGLKSANNIEYTVDVNTNNVEPYYTTTVTRGSETVYTADATGVEFCNVLGEPLYIADNATIPSYETCVNEQCTEYDCLQYDEETGECIEQGDCISTECIETQTNYPMTALY